MCARACVHAYSCARVCARAHVNRPKGGGDPLWPNEEEISCMQCHPTTSQPPNVSAGKTDWLLWRSIMFFSAVWLEISQIYLGLISDVTLFFDVLMKQHINKLQVPYTALYWMQINIFTVCIFTVLLYCTSALKCTLFGILIDSLRSCINIKISHHSFYMWLDHNVFCWKCISCFKKPWNPLHWRLTGVFAITLNRLNESLISVW